MVLSAGGEYTAEASPSTLVPASCNIARSAPCTGARSLLVTRSGDAACAGHLVG